VLAEQRAAELVLGQPAAATASRVLESLST
jgi:hypothetical protein